MSVVARAMSGIRSRAMTRTRSLLGLGDLSAVPEASWWIGGRLYHEGAKTQRNAKFLVAALLFCVHLCSLWFRLLVPARLLRGIRGQGFSVGAVFLMKPFHRLA
jgi:hypothetical protein